MSYDAFWEELSWAYPISKGELRLPIATHCLEVSGFDIDVYRPQFEAIIEELISSVESIGRDTIATKNAQAEIIPFLSWNYTGVVRFDCMIDTRWALKIIEINADYPDGLLLHDYTYGLLTGDTAYRGNHRAYEQFFRKDETTFIAIPKDAFFLDAYYGEYFFLKNMGYPVYIGSYDVLTRDGESLMCEWHTIHHIRRCVEVGKMTSDDAERLRWARVRYTNSFDLRILWLKDNLALIDHPLIPKTIEITDENWWDFITEKDMWVIKPTNMFEGHGVYIWRDHSDDDWRGFLMKHKNETYIAQEFVEVSRVSMEFYDEWGIKGRDVYFDVCPHFFVVDGKIVEQWVTLVRYSENKILNVAQGGWIGYI